VVPRPSLVCTGGPYGWCLAPLWSAQEPVSLWVAAEDSQGWQRRPRPPSPMLVMRGAATTTDSASAASASASAAACGGRAGKRAPATLPSRPPAELCAIPASGQLAPWGLTSRPTGRAKAALHGSTKLCEGSTKGNISRAEPTHRRRGLQGRLRHLPAGLAAVVRVLVRPQAFRRVAARVLHLAIRVLKPLSCPPC
jgi:hypothetical protein